MFHYIIIFLEHQLVIGDFNMAEIFEGTLVKENPEKAVTFVDNHDTEPRASTRIMDFRLV